MIISLCEKCLATIEDDWKTVGRGRLPSGKTERKLAR